MTAAEKAFYNLESAATYGRDLSPISKVTKKKVFTMIEESFENNKNRLLHHMGYTKEDFDKWNDTLSKMKALLETA